MAFKIQFDWQPELVDETNFSGSYGLLKIFAGDQNLTDNRSKSTNLFQEGVVVSAIPLAEWFVSNWHFLNFEQHFTQHFKDEFAFESRHRVLHANYGFVWPDITFIRFGDSIKIESKKLEIESTELIFTSVLDGSWIDVADFEREIFQYVNKVVEFLGEQNELIIDLIADWKTIQNLDSDESDFSKVSASLGYNPFTVEDEIANQIIQLKSHIPKDFVYEFSNFLHPVNFLKEAKKIDQVFEKFEKEVILGSSQLSIFKSSIVGFDSDLAKPWERGYYLAKKLTEILGFGETIIREGEEALFRKFELEENEQKKAIIYCDSLLIFIDAALLYSSGNPLMLINESRGDNRKFAFLRLIYKYLNQDKKARSFVFGKNNNGFDEQVSRAFAAEFLAPQGALRKELGNKKVLAKSELRKLAEKWIIPEKVLIHQINNHQIVKISDY